MNICQDLNAFCNSPLLSSPVFICRNEHGPVRQDCFSTDVVLSGFLACDFVAFKLGNHWKADRKSLEMEMLRSVKFL